MSGAGRDPVDIEQACREAASRARGWHNVVGASAEELRAAEIEALFMYGDIIDLPAHVSSRHPRQPSGVRAAQFSPFAALTGFEDEIAETGRVTQRRLELTDDERARLDGALRAIEARVGESPPVSAVVFEPDARKEGGRYVEVRGRVARVDRDGRAIVLADGRRIPLDDVASLG